ncbi:epoxide hydrolase [Cantharellus anzutake]|uniref:epoxide hydrolase n=1 Tax=Cantharellus anzutake TaxID=1750568 RepID=UPI001903CF89|nr:epoxide hydrolase [Cantharellus anzutake]KAF8338978.1 epoxide hydrolase [Cantharellus anzutake]
MVSSAPSIGILRPRPFRVSIPQTELDAIKTLLRLGRLPPSTFENSHAGTSLGARRDWIHDSTKYWIDKYDWRIHEAQMNSVPNYLVDVQDDDGEVHTIHFLASFAKDKNAIPLLLLHGCPSTCYEFIPLIKRLSLSNSSPFHIIAPSLPNFAFSASPPHINLTMAAVACLMDKLMSGLGYGSSYVVQGGDIGSFVARMMAVRYHGCKAVHLNFNPMTPPTSLPSNIPPLTEAEQKGLQRANKFMSSGTTYATIQSTNPSTMGAVMSCSPGASLAWTGEKLLEQNMPLDMILTTLTLYWFTQTYARSIYAYRELFPGGASTPTLPTDDPSLYIHKPFEVIPVPACWVATTGKLSFVRYHKTGGHFAAQLSPAEFANDLIEFFGPMKNTLATVPPSPTASNASFDGDTHLTD